MKLYGNTKLVFLSGYRNLDEKKILMIKDTKPLTGIRVLDIACFIAAPYAATISETPGTIDNLGPGLGDHNKDLYREELGLSDSELQSLKESGVI